MLRLLILLHKVAPVSRRDQPAQIANSFRSAYDKGLILFIRRTQEGRWTWRGVDWQNLNRSVNYAKPLYRHDAIRALNAAGEWVRSPPIPYVRLSHKYTIGSQILLEIYFAFIPQIFPNLSSSLKYNFYISHPECRPHAWNGWDPPMKCRTGWGLKLQKPLCS